MAHRVASLKYRPQRFDELTGQQHVVISLKGAVKSGRVGHAFLFAGPRGVGKTTTARILAKNLNCAEGPTIQPCQQCQSCREITLSRSIDVVEIDGASNRGIEEIRSLRDGVKYSPIHGRYKIYIIDEVHMLTQEAFNALLKTLEEPPPKVIFIFATTKPDKVPATILSRCQRFMFKRLSPTEIITRLKEIAAKENIKITEQALQYIAIRADGSIRDGESILEQLASFVDGKIEEKDVLDLIGFLGSSFYFELVDKIAAGDLKSVIILLNKGIEDGADPAEIYRGFTLFVRAILFAKTDIPENFIDLNEQEIHASKKIGISRDRLIEILEICLQFEDPMRRSVNVRIALELLFSQLVLLFNEPQESAGKEGNPERTEKMPDAPGDLKTLFIKNLEAKSPQLAGLVQKATITRDGKKIHILVDSDYSYRQLMRNQRTLMSIMQPQLESDCEIDVRIVEKKEEEGDLIKTIKGLFDGEEVR